MSGLPREKKTISGGRSRRSDCFDWRNSCVDNDVAVRSGSNSSAAPPQSLDERRVFLHLEAAQGRTHYELPWREPPVVRQRAHASEAIARRATPPLPT